MKDFYPGMTDRPMTAGPVVQVALDPGHMPPPLPIPLKVADEVDIIEDGTWWFRVKHLGPSGTGSQQLLGILRDERNDAKRELAGGFLFVRATAAIPLGGGRSR